MSEIVEGCWCTTCLSPMHKHEVGEGYLKCIKCGETWTPEVQVTNDCKECVRLDEEIQLLQSVLREQAEGLDTYRDIINKQNVKLVKLAEFSAELEAELKSVRTTEGSEDE